MSKRKFRTLEEAKIEYFKEHPEEIEDYLKVARSERPSPGIRFARGLIMGVILGYIILKILH